MTSRIYPSIQGEKCYQIVDVDFHLPAALSNQAVPVDFEAPPGRFHSHWKYPKREVFSSTASDGGGEEE